MTTEKFLITRIGEVVESRTAEFIAECYDLHSAPPFGSLVKTFNGSIDIYGIVYGVTTQSIDPGRHIIARGRDEDSEEAIYRQNPQLVKLLCTRFNTLVVGYRENGKIYNYYPHQPARVHGFIYTCSREEVNGFTVSLDFLHTLIETKAAVSIDELLAAVLRYTADSCDDSRAYLINAGKRLAFLLCNEPLRLEAILRKIRR
ncbi:MAG: hypothetical protein NTV30_05055 [Chloroflexi bacterium]|nr:hypothetical protein [Chloroflexota bacterium]